MLLFFWIWIITIKSAKQPLLVHSWRRSHRIGHRNYIRVVMVVSWRKHDRSPNSGRHVTWSGGNRMPHRCTIHPQSRDVRLLALHRWPYHRTVCRICACLLAGNWDLMRRNIAIVDAGNIMYAGSSSISVHGVQSNEILLRVARHLCWRPWYYIVSRYTPPISFPKFVQT